MTTAAIIQARMGSSRLPGKVMMEVLGKPILQWMIDRVKQAKCLDKIIVATTVNSQEIIYYCRDNGIDFFVGSEEDVMQRVICCTTFYNIDTIVDVTSDCPLLDPLQIDKLHEIYKRYITHILYDVHVSNINPRSWFDGADIQIYNTEVLKEINKRVNGSFRQHTGWNLIRLAPKFTVFKNLAAEGIYNWPGLRLTLDYKEDFEVIKTLIEHFVSQNRWETITVDEIVDFILDNPQILVNRKLQSKQPGE